MSESSSPPPPPILREARAAVFAALCVLVAALGHGAFSIGGIPLWALGTATAALYLGARLLTRRERGLTAILAVMAGVQVGLHFFFELAQRGAAMPMPASAAPTATPPTMAGMAGMANAPGMPALGRMWCGHKQPDLTATLLHIGAIRPGGPANPANPTSAAAATAAAHAATTAATAATTMTGGMTAGMLTVHVLAALVAAWWLRRGEAAAWSAAGSVGLFLFAPLLLLFTTVFAPATPTAAVVRTPAPRLGPGRLLRHFVTRRGPPVAVAAFC